MLGMLGAPFRFVKAAWQMNNARKANNEKNKLDKEKKAEKILEIISRKPASFNVETKAERSYFEDWLGDFWITTHGGKYFVRTHNHLFCFKEEEMTKFCNHRDDHQNRQPLGRIRKLSPLDFCYQGKRCNYPDAEAAVKRGEALKGVTRRRLVALPPLAQEPLYDLNLPAIQPTETIQAVENAGADGMPLGQLAAIPIATVLIGFTLFRSVKALLKRFRTPKKGKASTSGNDNGIT
jgi:hypothetical protein